MTAVIAANVAMTAPCQPSLEPLADLVVVPYARNARIAVRED
jgi:hypothetical protein